MLGVRFRFGWLVQKSTYLSKCWKEDNEAVGAGLGKSYRREYYRDSIGVGLQNSRAYSDLFQWVART